MKAEADKSVNHAFVLQVESPHVGRWRSKRLEEMNGYKGDTTIVIIRFCFLGAVRFEFSPAPTLIL